MNATASPREEWLQSLSPEQRARLARRDARKKKSDEISSLMISILSAREILIDGQQSWDRNPEWREKQARLSARIAADQLKLEKWAIKKLRLDHLAGVDKVYGIKVRKTK